MELSATKLQALHYPDPYIVPPRSRTHRQSFIILHGRGREGEAFSRELLDAVIPGFKNMQDAFPDCQFIFPTASKRRAIAKDRTPTRQWFDNWSLQDPTEKAEIQYEGLRVSSQYIHQLLDNEVHAVGAENVVLWGCSQGTAMSLISLLLWKGPKLAAVIGMCGWLPLKAQLEQVMEDDEGDLEDEDNPFDNSEPNDLADVATKIESSHSSEHSILEKAVNYLRYELKLPEGQDLSILLEIPIYLAHGTKDEKVPIAQAQEALELLRVLGFDVEFQQYDDVGHWDYPDMLHAIIQFLQRKKDIVTCAVSTASRE